MAKTKRDEQLRLKIKSIVKKLLEEKKDEKEIIYIIAGTCNISHRTASEHFHACKAQTTLEELGIDLTENCPHNWSNPFATARGLVKECKLCGKTQDVPIK